MEKLPSLRAAIAVSAWRWRASSARKASLSFSGRVIRKKVKPQLRNFATKALPRRAWALTLTNPRIIRMLTITSRKSTPTGYSGEQRGHLKGEPNFSNRLGTKPRQRGVAGNVARNFRDKFLCARCSNPKTVAAYTQSAGRSNCECFQYPEFSHASFRSELADLRVQDFRL